MKHGWRLQPKFDDFPAWNLQLQRLSQPAMGSCGLKSAILRPEKPAVDVWRSECHRWWKAGTIIMWPIASHETTKAAAFPVNMFEFYIKERCVGMFPMFSMNRVGEIPSHLKALEEMWRHLACEVARQGRWFTSPCMIFTFAMVNRWFIYVNFLIKVVCNPPISMSRHTHSCG